MKVLIDCTNLKVGGGIQVATSFIHDLNKLEIPERFVIVLSSQMKNNFKRDNFQSHIVFVDLPSDVIGKRQISSFLLNVERKEAIDRVFCVFGPSFYKSLVPKIVGYAIPHYIYRDSPYFKIISLKTRLKSFLRQFYKVALFKKNSDRLIFETHDAEQRFKQQFGFKGESFTVSNTINEIFFNQLEWRSINLTDKHKFTILVVSANYPHKNLQIIPRIIARLRELGHQDFKFFITVEESNINLSHQDKKFIEFLGKVDLNKLPSLYSECDIVFIPTLLEVFSATYLEAMYMQKPILTSDLSFARNICQEAALYFSPVDVLDAADKIVKLKDDELLQKELAKKGHIQAKKYGTSMDRTLAYLEIIRL